MFFEEGDNSRGVEHGGNNFYESCDAFREGMKEFCVDYPSLKHVFEPVEGELVHRVNRGKIKNGEVYDLGAKGEGSVVVACSVDVLFNFDGK